MFSKLLLGVATLAMLGAVDASHCNPSIETCVTCLDPTRSAATCSNTAFFYSGNQGDHCAGDTCTDAECCTVCTSVDNAVAPTVVTCWLVSNSQLTGNCNSGFWKDTAGAADACTTCASVTNAATVTCSSASDSVAATCNPGSWKNGDACTLCDSVTDGAAPTAVTCTAAGNSQLTGNCAAGKYKLAGTATTCPAIEECDSSRSQTTASVDGVSNNVCSACASGTFAVGNAACASPVTGKCAGNTVTSENVDCTGETTNTQNKGATVDRTDAATCCEAVTVTVTGKCTGNTGATGDVNCATQTANTHNKGATVDGTDAATCCEEPAACTSADTPYVGCTEANDGGGDDKDEESDVAPSPDKDEESDVAPSPEEGELSLGHKSGANLIASLLVVMAAVMIM